MVKSILMRKAYILLSLLLGVAAYGQKVDLDRSYFTASFRDLPLEPLDTAYHTFSVSAETGPISKVVMKPADLERLVMIDGWRRLSYDAHVQVQFKFEDVIIEQTSVKESVEILKDKNGKETGKRSSYSSEVTYSYAASAKLVDYKGQVVGAYTLASRDQKRVYNGDSYPTSAQAKVGLVLITNQLIRQSASDAINKLNYSLTNNYGYPDRVVSDYFWILDSRKHPEYENHRRAWITFKQAISSMTPDEPIDQVKAQLQPVIDYYNSVKKKYTSNAKADKKLRYASYYNLAKIYWYLDDPDSGMKEANELVINGYDSKDGNRLESGATDLKSQLRLAKRTSRHFKINVDEYQGIGYGGH